MAKRNPLSGAPFRKGGFRFVIATLTYSIECSRYSGNLSQTLHFVNLKNIFFAVERLKTF